MGSEELYSKRQNLFLRSADRELRKCSIHVGIQLQVFTTPVHRKELAITLTDERDLFFLYTLRLGEEEFHVLKSQQGLLVDFASFPQKVIDLLNLCQQEQNKEYPRFILQLESSAIGAGEMSSAVLFFIETNAFKHLTHLALKFLPATDADIKKHLAVCVQQVHESNRLLQQRLEFTDTDLTKKLRQTQEALSSSTLEVERLRSDWTAKVTELNANHHEQLNTEREKALGKLGETQHLFEKERRDLEQAHMRLMKNSESRILELEAANKSFHETRYKSESEIHELRSRLTLLEEENGRFKQEIQVLRVDNGKLDNDNHRLGSVIEQQKQSIGQLENEVRDGRNVAARSLEQLEAHAAYKKKVEEDLENKVKELLRFDSKTKLMAEELKKGNEIIRKLQSEIKNYHSKVKLRTHIATEQEKLLSDKDGEMERVKNELMCTRSDLKTTQLENSSLSERLEATTSKLEESRQMLKSNENVIKWLNKQLNDSQIQPRGEEINRRGHPNPSMNVSNSSSIRPYGLSDQPPVTYRPLPVQYQGGPISSRPEGPGMTASQRPPPSTNSYAPAASSNGPLIDPRYLQHHSPPSYPTSVAQSRPTVTQPKPGPPRMPQAPFESTYFPIRPKIN